MKPFAKKVLRFLAAEDGPTAVEYAVMLAPINASCFDRIQALGTSALMTFTNVSGQLGGS